MSDDLHRMELRLDFPDGQMWHCPRCERALEVDADGQVKVLFRGDERAGHVRDERDSRRARRLQPGPIESERLDVRPDDMVDRGENGDAESWGFGVEADRQWLHSSGIVW